MNYRNQTCNISLAVLMAFSLQESVFAVSLADSPVANLTTAVIKPNIFFILDDSGSMARYYLPDTLNSIASRNAFKNSTCNSLYYNPDPSVTYDLPVRADGTTYPQPSFTNAPVDGYGVVSSTSINLGQYFSATSDYAGSSGNAAYYYSLNSGSTGSKLSGITAPCYADSKYTKVTLSSSHADAQKFARWFSYYRTRNNAMKSAVGLAFKDLGSNFRVGFNTINRTSLTESSGKFLNIRDFDSTQKTNWYNQLYGIVPSGNTPLRTALSRAGRLYSGQLNGSGDVIDPITLSCQQNFTILSTDGYWNEPSQKGFKEDGSTPVGNQDGAAPWPFKDAYSVANTLADIAYYYYSTDLRPSMPNDVIVNQSRNQAVDDVATWQHMTTFTIGLGLDGLLTYQPNYKTLSSGDYNAIMTGTKNWGQVNENSDPQAEKIDDLWHAAVNGRGEYFSAKNPADVESGLKKALSVIASADGAGAAAATSNLEPVAGDDKIFVAQYHTNSWHGDVLSYTLNTGDGSVSTTANWSAGTRLDALPYTSRNIFTLDGSNLRAFSWNNLNATLKSHFNAKIMALSQYDASDTAKWPSGLTGETLVQYLAGDRSYEDNLNNAATNRRFRSRSGVLADVVNAQPIYVQKSPFAYTGGAFASRDGRLYVAANDGMLHAFDANTGDEVWAYIPPMVLQDIWYLADFDYQHRYFTDGSPVVGDIKTGAQWQSLLVAGLNKGGKGYYALDVTSTSTPGFMWNYTASDLGYTYGKPVIVKVNGQWAVVVSTGYNAPGQDKLVVLNAETGVKIKSFSTGQSHGIASFSVWVDDYSSDPSGRYAYAGDLGGNMWRFDLDAPDNTAPVLLAATGKPITTRPELAEIDGKKIVYFGTGQLLSHGDLADTSVQSFYAIKDTGATVAVASLEPRTIAVGTQARTITGNAINWNSSNGWYVNFTLTPGERVNVDPIIQLGLLAIVTNKPGGGACIAGGSSWVYFVDYKQGLTDPINQGASAVEITSSLSVGHNMVKMPDGQIYDIVTTADNRRQSFAAPVANDSGGGRRVSWREIITQ